MSTLANWTISITAPDGPDVLPDLNRFLSDRNMGLNMLSEFFRRCAAGEEPGLVGETKIIINKGTTQQAQTPAVGTLTIAGGSGAVGGTIGGQLVTATWATSDANSAALVAAAINANAVTNKIVSATSAAGVVTITALEPGLLGNQIPLVASGTGVTASGARLAGGIGGDGTNIVINF